jgi:hypothetical protein
MKESNLAKVPNSSGPIKIASDYQKSVVHERRIVRLVSTGSTDFTLESKLCHRKRIVTQSNCSLTIGATSSLRPQPGGQGVEATPPVTNKASFHPYALRVWEYDTVMQKYFPGYVRYEVLARVQIRSLRWESAMLKKASR